MQDTSARILQDSPIKVYEGLKPELKLRVNSHTKRLTIIRNTIDALLDIRLSLGVKKIISPTIKKTELLEIINSTKEKVADVDVKAEIDKVFEEYLPDRVLEPIIPNAKEIWNNANKNLSRLSVENKIDEALDKAMSLNDMEDAYNDQGEEKGMAFVKSDPHLKSSNNGLEINKPE